MSQEQMEYLRKIPAEEVKSSIVSLMSDYQRVLSENNLLMDIFKDHSIESRTLAAELGLSTGELKKWLCAMSILTWSYGQGFKIHESVQGWGKEQNRLNSKTGSWQNFIYWNLKGHMEIRKMFDRWIKDGNRIGDIKQLKR